eukprot:gnl/TRDRNA2_/TRDRNA2_79834_c2_seq1.p1 gnl/TRDRNA2_/TRDRNA2_79834_c2~~gnl/TRDRNA2_/TRDRNA2_79834_c2_seq1.p1  ORF type:complete len:239 (+),score=43.79 gnl/TRDRNA2_/TRDRNA2_79834_c2_seq1:81-719(+)
MFAVLNVVTAVFIAEMNRATNHDDEIAVGQKKHLMEVYCSKIREVFKELDKSGDGQLSKDEFEPLMHDQLLKTWLSTLDIDTVDIHHLFEVIADEDGNVALDDFVSGMSRVKGPAKSIDVLKLQTASSHLMSKIDSLLDERRHAPGIGHLQNMDTRILLQIARSIDAKLDNVIRGGSEGIGQGWNEVGDDPAPSPSPPSISPNNTPGCSRRP